LSLRLLGALSRRSFLCLVIVFLQDIVASFLTYSLFEAKAGESPAYRLGSFGVSIPREVKFTGEGRLHQSKRVGWAVRFCFFLGGGVVRELESSLVCYWTLFDFLLISLAFACVIAAWIIA
jgi:hypothetical protein